MSRTQAKAGFGVKFYIGNGATPTEVFTKLAELRAFTPPDVTLGTADATHMESDGAFGEDVATILRGGDASVVFNLVQGDATQALLRAAQASRLPVNFRAVLPGDAERFEFAAHVTSVGHATPMDGTMTLSATLKPTGTVARVAHT